MAEGGGAAVTHSGTAPANGKLAPGKPGTSECEQHAQRAAEYPSLQDGSAPSGAGLKDAPVTPTAQSRLHQSSLAHDDSAPNGSPPANGGSSTPGGVTATAGTTAGSSTPSSGGSPEATSRFESSSSPADDAAYRSPPAGTSQPSGAHLTAATPGQPRPQAMSPHQTESPLGDNSLPAIIRDALRRRSERRTGFFEHSVHKDFSNGDKYSGGWQAGLPQGVGVYWWADGSDYDGEWQGGVKEGEGKYTWPTGAVYRGDWHDGCMHGHGTLQGPDGSIYTGGWQKDQKHGLGRKVYAAGDVYEGLWKNGKPEGPGRYRWVNGNEYDGEWRAGRMHGQGTLKWASGDRYDGKWEDGEQSGVGVFTWADGSSYNGFWRNGRKHGVGVFKSTAELRPQSGIAERQASLAARLVPAAVSGRASYEASDRSMAAAAVAGSGADDAAADTGSGHGRGGTGTSERDMGRSTTALLRDYEDGALVREEAIPEEQLEAVLGKRAAPVKRRHRRARAKGPKRPGERIYKGHKSYDLMLNLQLGIRYSVGGVQARPSVPMLLPTDFQDTVQQYFPRDGSRATPPHPASNFKWKDYCPKAFNKLRATFHIDPADYMLSICGDKALRELPSPGKSGSVFFISHDERFFIKTMRRGEMELLLKLLPRYSAHIAEYPDTLLIKYLGLHRIKPQNGGKVRFVVMNNLLRTDVPLHRKFDLKGSTQGREAPPEASIQKDLNVDMRLLLPCDWHQRFERQLRADCALLEALRVMDYSLLLGIHSRSGGGLASTPQHTDAEQEDTEVEEPDSPVGASPTSRWPAMPARWPSGRLRRAASAGPSRQASIELPAWAAAAGGQPNAEDEAYRGGGGGEAGGVHGSAVSSSGRGELSGRSNTGPAISTVSGLRPPHAKQLGGGGGGAGSFADRDLQHAQQIILRRFGDKVSEQRVEDLLQLARYRKIGRAQKEARPPASFGSELPRATGTDEDAAGGDTAQQPQPDAGAAGEAQRDEAKAAAVVAGQRQQLPLGVRNAAMAVPDGGGQPEDVLLYFGIIDILQEYNVSKRVEHRFKALVHDSSTISAVSPVTYSRRFQSFLLNIFRPKPMNAAAAVLKLAMAAQNGEQDAAGSQQGAEQDLQQ